MFVKSHPILVDSREKKYRNMIQNIFASRVWNAIATFDMKFFLRSMCIQEKREIMSKRPFPRHILAKDAISRHKKVWKMRGTVRVKFCIKKDR